MDLEDRIILVTGGGKRLGRAIALKLGRAGAWIAVHHHASGAGARAVVAALEGRGRTYRADLRSVPETQALVAAVLADRGRLDGLVLNAADFPRTPFGTVTERDWDDVFALNLKAPFFLVQSAAPALKSSRGAAVLIGDVSARNPWVEFLPYCLTKTGIAALTLGLAKALAPEARANAVAPGPVLPPARRDAAERARLIRSTLLRRIGRPADVARAVRYLLEADYVTGQVLAVDGGQTIRPDRD
ncbi:MAG: SDR family oxidoreductase [Planctomycetes bacterium]|nr:SDR family oxidoreductase [Planctomycetota bacterium]